jgi:arylsulfatase A
MPTLTRRDALRNLFFTAAGSTIVAPALTRCSQNMRQKPNIVLIYTDDQGYGDMSALNPDSKFQTPNMDRIGHEGIIFRDGHCSDTVCTPSRYSLLTGRYSWRSSLKKGVLRAEGDCLIPNDRLTLASMLRSQGYNTAMIGKWHLRMEFPGDKGMRDWSQPITDGPTEKGFDYFYGIAASMNYGMLTYIENDRITEIPSMWTRKKLDKSIYQHGSTYYRLMPPYDAEQQQPGDIEVAPGFIDSKALEVFADKTVDYIDEVADDAKSGTPFFVYMPLTSPHLPHCTGEDFIGKSNMGAYGDFMMETDYRVGQVLDALDRQGLTDNTLVIFSSDNGAETNYHDQLANYQHASNGVYRGGKRDIYEGGHRVPFVMRWPGVIQHGSQCDTPVCQSDIMATLADILQVDLPKNSGEDSFSLLPLMAGASNIEREPIIHHSARGYFAIRDGKWKLNMFLGSGGSLPPVFVKPKPGEPPFELYDMENDYREMTNVYREHPDIVARLTEKITKIVQDGRSTPGPVQSNDGVDWWPELTWIEE